MGLTKSNRPFGTVDDQQTSMTRNTPYNKNLIATRFKTDLRRNFFSIWNIFLIDVKESRNVTSF